MPVDASSIGHLITKDLRPPVHRRPFLFFDQRTHQTSIDRYENILKTAKRSFVQKRLSEEVNDSDAPVQLRCIKYSDLS
jgi:hypothetical protein